MVSTIPVSNIAIVLNRHGYCEEHYQSHFVKKDAVANPPAEKKEKKAEAVEEKAAEAVVAEKANEAAAEAPAEKTEEKAS